MARERLLLTTDDMRRVLSRIAHEIVERNRGADDLVLIGLPTARWITVGSGRDTTCGRS